MGRVSEIYSDWLIDWLIATSVVDLVSLSASVFVYDTMRVTQRVARVRLRHQRLVAFNNASKTFDGRAYRVSKRLQESYRRADTIECMPINTGGRWWYDAKICGLMYGSTALLTSAWRHRVDKAVRSSFILLRL